MNKTKLFLIVLPIGLMLLTWVVDLYYYSILLDPMVIRWGKFMWVSPFWVIIAPAIACSVITIAAAVIIFIKRRQAILSVSASVVCCIIWVMMIVIDTKMFNFNAGICH